MTRPRQVRYPKRRRGDFTDWVPYGWYSIGWADEFTGELTHRTYFGQDLIIWADDEGGTVVQDAYCPHLGAHLGWGGEVEGGRIRCPFHSWEFDAAGSCVHIPYSTRLNDRAKLHTYPTCVRAGQLMVWYHPHGTEPLWELPDVDRDQWGEPARRDYQIEAPWIEVAENGVDIAHFQHLHGTAEMAELESYHTEGPTAKLRTTQKFPTPRGVADGRIDTDTWGPGYAITQFSAIVDTLLVGTNTPIDADRCHLRFTFHTTQHAGAGVRQAFIEEIDRQVQQDSVVWEHKVRLDPPALAIGDGPVVAFRRWAEQFHLDPKAG